MVWLESFAESSRFNWCETVMDVVQQMNVLTYLKPQPLKELGNEVEISLRRP
jgi:hypothetical protein